MQINNLDEAQESLVNLKKRFMRKFDKLVLGIVDLEKEVDQDGLEESDSSDKIVSIDEDVFRNY